MLAHNDSWLLPKILPVLRPHFDKFVVGYHESADNTLEILRRFDAIISLVPWSYDWGVARNAVIRTAEEAGCSQMMMIDSDECMLPSHLESLRNIPVQNARLFPRIEFVDDFQHYDPTLYPDYQARGFPLNQGFYYAGAIHEQLCRYGLVCSQAGDFSRSFLPLFHFGKCKPKREVALKYMNYDRIAHKLEPLMELPEDYVPPESWAPGNKKQFEGKMPW